MCVPNVPMPRQRHVVGSFVTLAVVRPAGGVESLLQPHIGRRWFTITDTSNDDEGGLEAVGISLSAVNENEGDKIYN